MTLVFFVLPVVLTLLLAEIPAVWQKSWRRALLNLPLVFFGITLPIWIFLVSDFLTPDSKAGAQHHWIACFFRGKLGLTPLVLYASAALYAVEIWRVANRTRNWIVLGFCCGAVVSIVCLIHGLGMFALQSHGIMDFVRHLNRGCMPWMLVPIYVAIWYNLRAIQLTRNSVVAGKTWLFSFLGMLPFWIGSLWWTRKIYESLPEETHGCFIVTAAARGHECWVGPFLEEETRNGKTRRVNVQLRTFRMLEARWQAYAPRSHAAFRKCYNMVGPIIARRITSPWIADIVYALLWPLEKLAAWIIALVPMPPA